MSKIISKIDLATIFLFLNVNGVQCKMKDEEKIYLVVGIGVVILITLICIRACVRG